MDRIFKLTKLCTVEITSCFPRALTLLWASLLRGPLPPAWPECCSWNERTRCRPHPIHLPAVWPFQYHWTSLKFILPIYQQRETHFSWQKTAVRQNKTTNLKGLERLQWVGWGCGGSLSSFGAAHSVVEQLWHCKRVNRFWLPQSRLSTAFCDF